VTVTLVGFYVIYDSLRVTRSVVLGEEIKVFTPSNDWIDISGLRELNSDIVGWIRIPGTDIDYPILQGGDNEHYLSRNYLGEFATAGSIFLDYRNDFSDDFIVVYGHRMSYGGMFTDIIKFQDRNFFDEHDEAEIFMGEQKVILRVVAFGIIRADNHAIYDLGSSAAEEMFANATHVREREKGRYVLLSTCDAHQKSMRDVIMARIIE
jgi:sortase B